MKRLLTWLAGLGLALAGGFVALFLATRGDQAVPALVTEDRAVPSAEIGGVKLHLRVAEGPVGAGTIVVLHGGPGGDFRSLQALDALTDAYRVVYYDQRGAGRSQRVDAAALKLEAHVAELHGVIAEVGGGPVVLLGHSWGAILATAYLGRHPEAVARAVLIEPGFLDAAGRTLWQERARGFLSGPGYALDALLTGFRAQHVPPVDPDARDDFLIVQMVHRFAGHPDNPYHCGAGYTTPHCRFGAVASRMLETIPDAALDRIAAAAGRYEGPVLLLSGACNTWTGPALQARHAPLFADARLVSVTEAGHDVLWDNPRSALAEIRTFLASEE